MNINSLRYLLALAEHQHFGKAAEVCCVSQPALSMQLKKLEEELGVQIFERSNKKVLISKTGQRIIEKAQQVMLEFDDLKQCAATYNPCVGPTRFGGFPTLAPYLFSKIIPDLKKQYPELKLQLTEERSDVLLRKLQIGQLDLVLLALPVDDDQLEVSILFDDPFYLAVSVEHPLAQLNCISQSDLIGQELLLLNEGHCLREQALDLCHTSQARENSCFQSTSLETLRQMVVANEAITLIPKTAVVTHPLIRYLPFEKPEPKRTIALVWRKSSGRAACFETLSTLIQSICDEKC